MTPLTLSRFWQRRVYEVSFLLSLALLALYAVPYFTDIVPVGLFDVSIVAAIAAGLTALLSIIFYFVKLPQGAYGPSLIIYQLFTATIALLIWQTGGVTSPFIALWMLTAFCSAVFAGWGILAIALTTGAYVAYEYINGEFTPENLTLTLFVSAVPTIISIFVWRQTDGLDDSSRNVKHLTNQLSEVASRAEIVINAIGDGVVAIDSVGVVQLINPAAQEILGWGKQDALALNYKSVLQMTDVNNHEIDPNQDPILDVLNTNQLRRAPTLTVETKSGKRITASMVVSPIGESGSGVIAVFRDVTKEKAEEREQAEFISTASHEMRTPVASIEGYLGLALNPQTAQVDIRARDYIMKAHEAAQHLGRLFQDLLDVSKSEDGRMTNIPKVVDMAVLTATIVEGLRAKAQEKGLQLNFKPADQRAQRILVPVYYVNQDNDHIREILNNLIENAIKYTPQGSVIVDITGGDDKVVISVKDSGLGIPAEDVPHLFQKFYRVNNSDRQSIGGTGLGLYLARRLTEVMQGRLWVESVYGQGSTFFVELPRITTDDAEQLKHQQAATAVPSATNLTTAFPTTGKTLGPNDHSPHVMPAPVPAPVDPPMAMARLAPQPAPQPIPQLTPTPQPILNQPVAIPVQQAPQAPITASTPLPTVPRGQSLTREQIAQRVQQLEAMARDNNRARTPDGR